MSPKDLIIGLDIGASKIKIAMAETAPEDLGSKINIIGVVEVPSAGVNRGTVTAIEEATSAISHCLEKAERLSGLPITSAWVGIASPQLLCQSSKGIIAVSKTNNEITEEDVERAIESSRTVLSPPNYEILHVIPKSFIIDNQERIKDPIGMSGSRLEAETQIIQGLSSQIRNLTKSVYRSGLDIDDLVYSVLATAESTLTARQKELGVVLVNLGSSTTSLIVFEEGEVLSSAVLPLGSNHITADIAIGLRTSIDLAEEIKIRYGSSLPKELGKKEDVPWKEVGLEEEGTFSRKYVAEIIEARVEEIFDKIDSELKKIDRSGMLPAGAVLTGGGAKLPKIIELGKRKLRLPVSLGYALDSFIMFDQSNDLAYTTALGLALWGAEIKRQKQRGFRQFISRFRSVDRVVDKMRKWFQSLI